LCENLTVRDYMEKSDIDVNKALKCTPDKQDVKAGKD
jgi:hypothetical protein